VSIYAITSPTNGVLTRGVNTRIAHLEGVKRGTKWKNTKKHSRNKKNPPIVRCPIRDQQLFSLCNFEIARFLKTQNVVRKSSNLGRSTTNIPRNYNHTTPQPTLRLPPPLVLARASVDALAQEAEALGLLTPRHRTPHVSLGEARNYSASPQMGAGRQPGVGALVYSDFEGTRRSFWRRRCRLGRRISGWGKGGRQAGLVFLDCWD
jgi:hypothetical protein